MPNPSKIEEVKQLKELLSSYNIQLITDHTGLSVAEIGELRRQLKENGALMRVCKNRLLKLARAEAGLIAIDEVLEGPSSMVLAVDDPVSVAKVIKSSINKVQKPKVKALIIDDKLLDISKFEELATLPGIDELRAKMVGSLNAPISGFVFTLSGLLRRLAIVMRGIAEKKKATS